MSGEVTNEEVIEQPDADFDAGFADAPDQTQTPEVEATEEPVVEEEAPQQKYAQITEDQFKDLMAKAAAVDEIKAESQRKFDTAFGQLGGMKQLIERIQKETPSGQSVQVTDEDFAELKSEFPELAEMQIRGLNKVLSKMQGSGQATDGEAVKQLSEQLAQAREDALDRLNDIVPSWDDEVRKPSFADWMNKQDGSVQALGASNNVRDAAKMLRLYRDRPVDAPKPTVSSRQRQLEAAVAPKSARGSAPEAVEVDEFEAGFNSARN